MIKKNVKVEVFVPAEVCGCTFSSWIERVYWIINNNRDLVEVDSYSTQSARAAELGITSSCVMVNGNEIPVHKLEESIRENSDS